MSKEGNKEHISDAGMNSIFSTNIKKETDGFDF